MERRRLTDDELKESISELDGWDLADGKLKKEFKFGSFAEAIAWMVAVAIYADKLDHHPNWCNVYSRVSVNLHTHDLAAITTWDIALARRMDAAAS